MLFVLASPEVYKAPNSDCYIVFGEAKIEDMTSQAQLSQQQQYSGGGAQNIENSGVAEEEDDDDDDIPELEAPDDDAAPDETGVEAKDIELVMAQVNCSRAKAVRALKDSGGDLINASCVFFLSAGLPAYDLQLWPRASSSFFVYTIFDKTVLQCLQLRLPPPQLDIVIAPFPPVLHDFHAPQRTSARTPNNQTELFCSEGDELRQLAVVEHVVVSVENLRLVLRHDPRHEHVLPCPT